MLCERFMQEPRNSESFGGAVSTEVIPSSEMPSLFPGTTEGSWAQHRYRGTGPRFVKIGRKVFYRREDVATWLDSQAKNRTDDRPDAA